MPQLLLTARGKGKPTVFPLFKKITTIGASPDNDVVLTEPGIAACHAHIPTTGRTS